MELESTASSVQSAPAPAEDDDGDDVSDDSTAALAPAAPETDAAAQAPADGQIALPTVQSLAGTAADKMKKLHSQASILEARIAQTQMENEAKLARQKTIFEQKLKTQDDNNRDVMDVNANISAQVQRLKTGNANLRKKAKELQDGNHLKQQELQTLTAKLDIAKSFIGESLQATNDQHSTELNVLQSSSSNSQLGAKTTKKKAPTASMFHASRHAEAASSEKDDADDKDGADDESTADDEEADADSDSKKVSKKDKKQTNTADEEDDDEDDDQDEDDGEKGAESFVAVKSKVHRIRVRRRRQMAEADLGQTSNEEAAPSAPQQASSSAQPQDLLAVLTSGVENLAKEDKASDARLKTLFMTAFKKGTKRHTALLTQQKTLRQEKARLEAMQNKLETAVEHLEKTKANLKERLHGLGLFLQRLGHLAVAPAGETQRLMKSLPDKVQTAQEVTTSADKDDEAAL